MTYYSKKSIISIITQIIIFIAFYPNVLGQLCNQGLPSEESLAIWGKFFLIWLAANIIIKLVVFIIFKIITDTFSKDKEPTIRDERDHLIELKAIRNFCFTFAFGFFLAMATLFFKQPIDIMFTILAFSCLLSGLTLDGSYIFYYEREA